MRCWNYRQKSYYCPIGLALDRFSGRWKTNILWFIWTGTNHFNQICRELPRANKGVISRQLRELEEDGLVTRHVLGERPLSVEYRFTELDRSLEDILAALGQWGNEHGEVVS